MTLQYSDAVRDAKLDAIESTIGTSPKLFLYSGSVPANCAAADPSGQLAMLTLPSDWDANAAAGSKAKSGTWSGTASAGGTAISFRVKDSSATTTPNTGTTHIQGTVGLGSGDLSLDNNVLANGQTITINTFTINDNNP